MIFVAMGVALPAQANNSCQWLFKKNTRANFLPRFDYKRPDVQPRSELEHQAIQCLGTCYLEGTVKHLRYRYQHLYPEVNGAPSRPVMVAIYFLERLKKTHGSLERLVENAKHRKYSHGQFDFMSGGFSPIVVTSLLDFSVPIVPLPTQAQTRRDNQQVQSLIESTQSELKSLRQRAIQDLQLQTEGIIQVVHKYARQLDSEGFNIEAKSWGRLIVSRQFFENWWFSAFREIKRSVSNSTSIREKEILNEMRSEFEMLFQQVMEKHKTTFMSILDHAQLRAMEIYEKELARSVDRAPEFGRVINKDLVETTILSLNPISQRIAPEKPLTTEEVNKIKQALRDNGSLVIDYIHNENFYFKAGSMFLYDAPPVNHSLLPEFNRAALNQKNVMGSHMALITGLHLDPAGNIFFSHIYDAL